MQHRPVDDPSLSIIGGLSDRLLVPARLLPSLDTRRHIAARRVRGAVPAPLDIEPVAGPATAA
jgi:hypothetical protein